MSGVPAFLLNSPHLPIENGQGIADVVRLVKNFYNLALNKEDYKGSQVYRSNSTGLLQFDLIGLDGELITQFVNHASGSAVVEPVSGNTPTITFGAVNDRNWLAKSVLVYDAAQLDVFKSFSNGYQYDAMNPTNDLGFTLSKLLNLYTETPVWQHSSFAEYSTAKFTLVYAGPSQDAPEELDITGQVNFIVVIQIQSGQHQGLICFLAPQ